MGKKKKNQGNKFFVYSTNPDPDYEFTEENEMETPDPSEQRLRVQIEKKGRAGKTVTVVKGFEGNDDEMKLLAKKLKSHCGSGGSVKDGEILVQGELKQKVIEYLRKLGYKDTK